MARTKQTSRKSMGGKAPRRPLARVTRSPRLQQTETGRESVEVSAFTSGAQWPSLTRPPRMRQNATEEKDSRDVVDSTITDLKDKLDSVVSDLSLLTTTKEMLWTKIDSEKERYRESERQSRRLRRELREFKAQKRELEESNSQLRDELNETKGRVAECSRLEDDLKNAEIAKTDLQTEVSTQTKRLSEMEDAYKALLRRFSQMQESVQSQMNEMAVELSNSVDAFNADDSVLSVTHAAAASDSQRKKRRLSETQSTDELPVSVSAAAFKQMSAIVKMGHKPYWRQLDWRSDAFGEGAPFLSPGCLQLIADSGLTLEHIQDCVSPTIAGDSVFSAAIFRFLRKNGFLNAKPKVEVRTGAWRNLVGNAVVVKKITEESMTHTRALLGQMGVFANRALPSGCVLSEYFGIDYPQHEFEAVFGATREETHRDNYAINKRLGDIHIVTDPLALCEPFDGFSNLFPNAPSYKRRELVFALLNDCRKDIDKYTAADESRRNCKFEQVLVNGWPRMFVICTRDISAGEEILAWYGEDYAAAHRRHQLYLRKCEWNSDFFDKLIA